MTGIKNKAVQLIENLPDDKVVYIVNIIQELNKLFDDGQTIADKQEKMKAFEILQQYRKPSEEEHDYKEELAQAMEEKYENIG